MGHGSGTLEHPIIVRLRRTRSGAEYSPFAIAPIASSRELSLGELVERAVREEGRALEPDPGVEEEGIASVEGGFAGDMHAHPLYYAARRGLPEFALPPPVLPPNSVLCRPRRSPRIAMHAGGEAPAGSSAAPPMPQPPPDVGDRSGRTLHAAPLYRGQAPAPGPQQRANLQRKRKREAAICERGYRPSPYSLERHIRPATPLETNLDYGGLPST